ncbi:MAG: HU family DNA-binding protein [Parabacteroides gordonii]
MEEGAITSQGFGTFTLWPQSKRTGRNPQTGSPH